MAHLDIPKLKPIPEGATREDRERMYQEHIAEIKRRNPRHFNADGTRRSVWDIIEGLFT